MHVLLPLTTKWEGGGEGGRQAKRNVPEQVNQIFSVGDHGHPPHLNITLHARLDSCANCFAEGRGVQLPHRAVRHIHWATVVPAGREGGREGRREGREEGREK